MGFQNIGHKQFWKDDHLKWICGFANAQGGTLYIGINGNDVVTTYSYNQFNRRLENIYSYSSQTNQQLQNVTYTYDPAGNQDPMVMSLNIAAVIIPLA